MNFCDAKFISFEAFEQLNRPTPSPPFRSTAARSPAAARSRASSHVAIRRVPLSRTIGSVSRDCPYVMRRFLLTGRFGASMLYRATTAAHARDPPGLPASPAFATVGGFFVQPLDGGPMLRRITAIAAAALLVACFGGRDRIAAAGQVIASDAFNR